MARSSTRDMTEGSPTKLIFGFFFPLLFGVLFQQVYNMVDTMVVGRFLGVRALAGVGATGPFNFLVLGFCMGICNGFAIPVAQKFGERDFQGLKRFVVNAILVAALCAAVMTLLVCSLCRTVLMWMNTPEDIMEEAFGYIFVVFLGIPVVCMYNVLFGIIRSLGDSKTPVMYLVFCSALNVALDLLFILVVRLGVSGAALATVISQACSALLCARYIRKSDAIILHREDWRMNPSCVKRLLGMGIPMGLQYSITAAGAIVLQTAVNTLGSVCVASTAAAQKVSQLFSCPFDAMGSTMVTYGGQNVGAGRLDRIGKGLRSCLIMGTLYALAAFGVLWLFSRNLLHLYVDPSEAEVIANARMLLMFNSSMYPFLAYVNIVRFLIQGLGFTRKAVFAGVCEMAARAAVGLFVVPAVGYIGACMANPAAWLAADLFLFPAYFHTMRTLRARQRAGVLPTA